MVKYSEYPYLSRIFSLYLINSHYFVIFDFYYHKAARQTKVSFRITDSPRSANTVPYILYMKVKTKKLESKYPAKFPWRNN